MELPAIWNVLSSKRQLLFYIDPILLILSKLVSFCARILEQLPPLSRKVSGKEAGVVLLHVQSNAALAHIINTTIPKIQSEKRNKSDFPHTSCDAFCLQKQAPVPLANQPRAAAPCLPRTLLSQQQQQGRGGALAGRRTARSGPCGASSSAASSP